MVANQSVESAEISPPAPQLNDPATAARAAELRRINWLTIYIPLILAVVLALALLSVLTWAGLFAGGDTPSQVDRTSGIADIFLTLICLAPLTLVCAILPLGGIGFLYWRQQNGSLVRERTQTFLRKVDSSIGQADEKINETTPKIINPVIQARSWIEGGFVLLDKLVNAVKNGVAEQTQQPNRDNITSDESEQSS